MGEHTRGAAWYSYASLLRWLQLLLLFLDSIEQVFAQDNTDAATKPDPAQGSREDAMGPEPLQAGGMLPEVQLRMLPWDQPLHRMVRMLPWDQSFPKAVRMLLMVSSISLSAGECQQSLVVSGLHLVLSISFM